MRVGRITDAIIQRMVLKPPELGASFQPLPLQLQRLFFWRSAPQRFHGGMLRPTLAQAIFALGFLLPTSIGFAQEPEDRAVYGFGMGFYSAAWSLIDQPLAPEGTLARQWKEREPTWDSVFQTVEGGLGYWRGNRFRYGPPKFSMNATPQCYDYEVGSPGWSFFYDTEALPAYRRFGVNLLPQHGQLPGPDCLLHSRNLEQDWRRLRGTFPAWARS